MNERSMTLGMDWQGENPAGWLASEKLDGCRAFWDGQQLWTRGGNVVNAPQSFLARFPAGVPLDGELWAGRGNLEAARKATQFGGKWFTPAVRFVAFDAPEADGTWPERMATIPTGIERAGCTVCRSHDHLRDMLFEVQSSGGEGLVIRHPAAKGYQRGRTRNLLKVKFVAPVGPFTLIQPTK